MKEYLQAVQKVFWNILGCSAFIMVLALPINENRRLTVVLNEISLFHQGFDKTALRKLLYDRATSQGIVSLDNIVESINTSNKNHNSSQEVVLANHSSTVRPIAVIDLDTLGSISNFSGEQPTVDIYIPDREQLSASIQWRLNRLNKGNKFKLTGISLSQGVASASNLAVEQEVISSQNAGLNARKDWSNATEEYGRFKKLYEQRLKWKAPWKVVLKTQERMNEAQAEMEEKQRTLDRVISRYEELAQKAQQFRNPTNRGKEDATTSIATAHAALLSSEYRDPIQIEFPVATSKRIVIVPHLTGCDFTATKAARLWTVVKDRSPLEAIQAIRERFSWHYSYFEIGGIRIGGMTVLRWSPFFLVMLFVLLLFRIRKAQDSYNPYRAKSDWSLPIVGFNLLILNFITTVVMPTTASILCVWSLIRIEENAIATIICSFMLLGLGILGHIRMDSLRNLRDAVTRSHSIPPADLRQ